MFLLSWRGSVVCLQGNEVVQMPIGAGAPLSVTDKVLAGTRVTPAPVTGCISISRDETFLCADPNARAVAFSRQAAGSWESFLPVEANALALLARLLGCDWIFEDTRMFVPRSDIGLRHGFRLDLGPLDISLPNELKRMARENNTPDRVMLRRAGAEVKLVPATPRGSALLKVSAFPVRARREAETMAIAAHRSMLRREPTQESFLRDAAFLESQGGGEALGALLDRLRGQMVVPPSPDAAAERTVQAWATREVAPWATRPVSRSLATQRHEQLNETVRWAALYRIECGEAALAPKPEAASHAPMHAARAGAYLRFLQSVARAAPDLRTSLLIGVGDKLPQDFALPVFCFQKKLGAKSLLLPDIDLLGARFHVGEEYQDRLDFAAKTHTAAFAGSTTGGLITEEIVRDLTVPRLRAAAYFNGNPRVDFRLPSVVQTASVQAEELLKAQPYCQKPKLSWRDQFRSRFLLSMDGNGATCARVAIALRSNSVLMKYDSEHVLYYFGGLTPWVHYAPIARDEDVEHVMRWAEKAPALFASIADQGRLFALEYLTQERAIEYTVALLRAYEECSFL